MTIKPNSIGLDSGCVYGKRLSALVLSSSPPLSSKLAKRQEEPISSTEPTAPRQMRPAVNDDEEESTVPEEDSEDELPASDSPKESEFDEVEVELAGKKAWVVSVACSA